jgi:alkaline phosphatase D
MLRIALTVLILAWASQTVRADSYLTDLSGTPDRVWIGSGFWANRLQDWRVEDHRIVCVEDAPRFPLRTLSLLEPFLSQESGSFEASVDIGFGGGDVRDGAFAGLLLGVGGPTVDYRVSAQTHHRPAADGGLIVAADHAGRIHLYNNEQGGSGRNQWTLGAGLKPGELVEIEPRDLPESEPAGAFRLALSLESVGNAYRLMVTTHTLDGDESSVLDRRIFEDFDGSLLTGSAALISHLGRHWFDNVRLDGQRTRVDRSRRWGPVLITMYTVDQQVLKLTAQMGPLGRDDTQTARLAIFESNQNWRTLSQADLAPDSYTFSFRVPEWDASRPARLRVEYDLRTKYGTRTVATEVAVPAEPNNGELVIASLNCQKTFTGDLQWNHDSIWFPHAEVVSAVAAHKPDLIFFAGDQIYEGDLVGVDRRTEDIAVLDYLYKWYRFCWSFKSLTRTHPTVAIPDDHDVYHGNLWGAGGRLAVGRKGVSAQDAGGYKMSARFVNAVHRTQTSHLPDAPNPGPIGQGISVYYTDLTWGGVSFAILADRMFKDSATDLVPEGKVVNGWFQNPDFDPRDADVPGARLLGFEQEQFLRDWASDWSGGAWMKGVLSQTIFANVATLPVTAKSDGVVPGLPVKPEGEYAAGDAPAADTDSNGWPQAGRNRALRAMRTGFAFQLAGDQHLGSLVQYGVDDWRDAGVAFCSPAIANTWPRRWFPPAEARAGVTDPNDPAYTGDFFDGFGNRITVYAVANPRKTGLEPSRLYDRAPGYGIIRLNRASRTITMECWPRWAHPDDPNARQFTGWPRTFTQDDMFNPGPARLDTIEAQGLDSAVFQVIDENTGSVLSAIRIDAPDGSTNAVYRPRVPGNGRYTVRVGEPDQNRWRTIQGLRPTEHPATRRIPFNKPQEE